MSLLVLSDKWTNGLRDGWFYLWFDWSHDRDSHLLDTNLSEGRFISQAESPSALFCEVAHWVLCCVAFHLVPLVLMLSYVDNLDDCEEKKWSFGSFGEDLLCTVLRAVVVNCPERAVDFLRARSILIKMYLSLISYKFLICDTHRKLLWWNIVVGNFRPNKQNLLTIALLVTSCWWHNKHILWLLHLTTHSTSTKKWLCVNRQNPSNQKRKQPTVSTNGSIGWKTCLIPPRARWIFCRQMHMQRWRTIFYHHFCCLTLCIPTGYMTKHWFSTSEW